MEWSIFCWVLEVKLSVIVTSESQWQWKQKRWERWSHTGTFSKVSKDHNIDILRNNTSVIGWHSNAKATSEEMFCYSRSAGSQMSTLRGERVFAIMFGTFQM